MRYRKDNPRGGFTLVEMLVVLVIIMSLAGVVTVNVIRYQARARVDSTKLQLKQLHQAVRLYQSEQGRIPTMEQGLEALVSRPTRPPVPERYPPGGYLDTRQMPRDGWGNEFIYLVPGSDGAEFEIVSYGSDGEPGGTGDDADLSSLYL
jgi:general secretion pathway protein G